HGLEPRIRAGADHASVARGRRCPKSQGQHRYADFRGINGPPRSLRSLPPEGAHSALRAAVRALNGIMSLTIEEVDDATALAGDLFRRTFAHPIPDFPRHFVAFSRLADGSSQVAGYIHYSAWETAGWLCGGLCVDSAAYNRASPADAAAWKHAGGIG